MPNAVRALLFANLALFSAAPATAAPQTAATSPADESVISFDSDITVNVDSTILVRESVTILAKEGVLKNQIRRDIPTVYSDRFGNNYQIHLEVGSVSRDDQPIDFHLERIPNGLRVCMGSRREALPPGEHTYELTYIVNRELGFFSDYDELYWNVTGNGWKVPIGSATATVHLPRGIAQIAMLLDGYTGRADSVGNDFTASADNESNATFRTKRPLDPGESLILVVRWPNGFVHPPNDAQKHQYYMDDNQSNFIGLLGLGIIALYYILIWFVAGRGRSRGDLLPSPDPPEGLSPAALRYIWRRSFDQKTVVANLVDLAVKKQLAILEDAGGAYILGRVKSSRRRARIELGSNDPEPGDVSADEALVAAKVFAEGDPVALKPSNHVIIGAAVEALHQHLRMQLEWRYFLATSRWLVPGLLISLAAVIRAGLVIQGTQAVFVIPASLAAMLLSVALIAVGILALGTFKNALVDAFHASSAKRHAFKIGLIFLGLFICGLAALVFLAWAASVEVAALLLVLIAINYFFYWRLQGQMLAAHPVMDEIESLRLFMISDDSGQPCLPGLFETLLPYALALNVEKIWGEKFAGTLADLPRETMSDYTPEWYSGPNWHPVTAAAFLTTLGSAFSSAISYATTGMASQPSTRMAARTTRK
jgi:hypothetical protein